MLLHGWGVDSRSWQPLQTLLTQFADVWLIDMNYQHQSAESLCEAIVDILPERSLLIGWSLGGMLATHIVAGRYGERRNKSIMGLVTLAANSQFVATENWPTAMEPAVFSQFLMGAKNNLSKQLKRFYLLITQGDEHSQTQYQWLQKEIAIDTIDEHSLIDGLDILNEINNTQQWDSIEVPSLFLFGENDKLVPADVAKRWGSNHKNKQCYCLKHKGHCLHYPDGECRQLIQQFLEQLICD